MNERDEMLLRDMLDMARKAQVFLGGRSREIVDHPLASAVYAGNPLAGEVRTYRASRSSRLI